MKPVAASIQRRAGTLPAITSRTAPTGLALLLIVGVGIRLAVLGSVGHEWDVDSMAAWGELMARVEPWRFYEHSRAMYPALLYPLWALAEALDGEALRVAVKALSIPFDAALGVLLFAALRSAGPVPALGAAAVYLLNPAAIIGGAVWGQVDSARTLASLGSLVALGSRRHATAGALSVVAGLLKPQFGLVTLVTVGVVVLGRKRNGTWRPLVRAVVGMALAYAIIAGPLALDPFRYLAVLGAAAESYPATSLGAFNPWGLVVGMGVPDDPYIGLAAVLLLLGIGGALSGLRRPPDLAVVLGVGAVLALAFYFLPTRVHERHLFPALGLLAPFAVVSRAHLAAYVTISAGFAASLLYNLHVSTDFTLPAFAAAVLVSPSGMWAIGLVLMASAIAWSWMLVIRRPRLPSASVDSPARRLLPGRT
ncbi:MAG TPA: hypothetical protein VHK63_09995 [Candidatus Limnocylindria bacterium]|nr:hypothetical protein [Candidatus Limnocylindria bacterium]